jgi:transposase InsO family protein
MTIGTCTTHMNHTKTKVKSPHIYGICKRCHKIILQEIYQVTFRKKLYADLESLQVDLDEWLMYYNEQRTHSGKDVLWPDTSGHSGRRKTNLEGKVCGLNLS